MFKKNNILNFVNKRSIDMAHICEAALVTCEDFRLHQRKDGSNFIAQFIKEEQIDCDLITSAGAILDLVRPKHEEQRKSLMEDIDVSVNLHKAQKIYIVHHEDCGAYGGKEAFSSDEKEFEQHKADMLEASALLESEFPKVEIITCWAALKSGTHDEWLMEKLNSGN